MRSRFRCGKREINELYQIRLHRNDINGGDGEYGEYGEYGGDGNAVSLQLIAVGTRHVQSPRLSFRRSRN